MEDDDDRVLLISLNRNENIEKFILSRDVWHKYTA